MSSGYYQIRLKDGPTGSDVTTFVCDRGIFRFLVMPMGIHPASDALSEQMQAIFACLFRSVDGTASAGARLVRDLDDFLYGAPTHEEMLRDLRTFLQLCRKHGVYLNPSKFRVAVDDGKPETSVTFAGIRVKQDGTYEVDPDRLESIRNFPKPTTRRQMQRWLGLCNSLLQFAPTQLHNVLDKQREICRLATNGKLIWNPQADEEFEKAREALSHPSTLYPFDPKLALGILTDVAKTVGIGIILFQYDPKKGPPRPGNFQLNGLWSIKAKPAWAGLSPLETEIMGFYQASQKLHFYIYGARQINGFVDHQPFPQTYHNKDLSELSIRMRKLMMDLFELPYKMTYVSNKSQLIQMVDTLSRAPTKEASELVSDPLDTLHHPDNRLPSGYTVGDALLFASNSSGGEWYAEDPLLAPLFDAAQEDRLYSEICKTIESMNAGFSKHVNVPADTEALQFLHGQKKAWAKMGTLTNSKGQKLIWLDGEQIFPPPGMQRTHPQNRGLCTQRFPARPQLGYQVLLVAYHVSRH